MHLRRSLSIFTLLLAGLGALTVDGQVVIVPAPVHEYTFTTDLTDSAGGPTLQSFGGTVSNGSYIFDANQGLLLTNASLSSSTYTLEALFTFDSVGGYTRIIDVKDRTSDTGLYARNGSLNFYNVASATEVDFVAGQPIHVVLTREGASQTISGYVNGLLRFSFADTGGLGELTAANKGIYLFMDDLVVANEASAGSVDLLRVFNQSLNAAQVLELYQNGAPSVVPEPSTWALLTIGLAFVGVVAWRRRRS
jgi:hypothetical protein